MQGCHGLIDQGKLARAGRAALGVGAGGLQLVEEVEVAGLVVLQRDQRRRQALQQRLILLISGST